MDDSHIFSQSVLVTIPLIGVWLVLGYLKPVHDVRRGFPLYSVPVAALSGEGSAPQLE